MALTAECLRQSDAVIVVTELGDFLRDWLRKDSPLPASALRERFRSMESTFRILCSKDFGLRDLAEQAWMELGYDEAVAAIMDSEVFARAVFGMVLFVMAKG